MKKVILWTTFLTFVRLVYLRTEFFLIVRHTILKCLKVLKIYFNAFLKTNSHYHHKKQLIKPKPHSVPTLES